MHFFCFFVGCEIKDGLQQLGYLPVALSEYFSRVAQSDADIQDEVDAIWYHLHNLKNVKTTHVGVLL